MLGLVALRSFLLPLALSPLLAFACRGADSSGTGGSAPPGVHAAPPHAGPAHAPDGQGSATFAISRLFLGDADPGGKPDVAGGWKHWGFDLDGVISAQTPDGQCRSHFGTIELPPRALWLRLPGRLRRRVFRARQHRRLRGDQCADSCGVQDLLRGAVWLRGHVRDLPGALSTTAPRKFVAGQFPDRSQSPSRRPHACAV
jgi:hypothetical protein